MKPTLKCQEPAAPPADLQRRVSKESSSSQDPKLKCPQCKLFKANSSGRQGLNSESLISTSRSCLFQRIFTGTEHALTLINRTQRRERRRERARSEPGAEDSTELVSPLLISCRPATGGALFPAEKQRRIWTYQNGNDSCLFPYRCKTPGVNRAAERIAHCETRAGDAAGSAQKQEKSIFQ